MKFSLRPPGFAGLTLPCLPQTAEKLAVEKDAVHIWLSLEGLAGPGETAADAGQSVDQEH